jgi:hypothetical protein
MRRDALERSVRASSWNEDRFDRALEAAVRDGAIKRLPLEFYGCADADERRRQAGGGDAAKGGN